MSTLHSSLSIYLHIPFCRKRCTYCAFNTYTDQDAHIESYITALCREIQLLGHQEPVHTLYLGGGTPSLLSVEQVKVVIKNLQQSFQLTESCEITLEANPGTVDLAYWQGLRETGVNRISMGMQSAVSDELSLFARDHSLADVERSIQDARRAGFENLSLDLIYGIPNQSLANWQATVQQALTFEPDHISAYALILESGTELTRQIRHGELPSPDDDLAADMYDYATETLAAAGFQQYEISNWAQPNRTAQHNIQYWRNLPYLGLGAGAHGYINGFRTVNVMRPEIYIDRLKDITGIADYPRTPATQSLEPVDKDQEIFETLMMGLRLIGEGIDLDQYQQRFAEPITQRYGKTIERLKQRQLLIETDGCLRLTHQARLLSNQVFEAFVL